MTLKLVKLTPEYKSQLEDMMSEWLAVEQDFSPSAIRRNDYRDFDYYLEHLETKEEKDGKVPDSVYFCLDEETNRFVGAVNIRHYLNENTCHTGGHIGDGVRPSRRRQGIATAMIGLALEKCREMGMHKVLMTCDKDNIGSAKSIRNNGGVLELEVEEDGILEQRYWITLEEEVIESPRLRILREMPGDYPDVVSWVGDPRVLTYLKAAKPLTKAEELIAWLERNDPNSQTRYVMILRSKENGEAVGTLGLFYVKEEDVWDIAYTIRFADWGKGYAEEGTRAMMDYVTQKYGAHTFVGECAVANRGSARVMEKLGMTYVGSSSYTKKDGTVFASAIYRKELGES